MYRGLKLSLKLAIIFVGAVLTVAPSLAATNWPLHRPYSFEVVDQTIHVGKDVPVTFRLIETSTGKPISGATITEPTLEILRQDAAPAPIQINALSPDSQGNYLLKSDLTMAGDWELQFYFQTPGESTPVHGTLMFRVVQ